MSVYRVTVRGQFKGLSEAATRYLRGSAAEHDLFVSSFTQEGTFTYDERLQFFNLRYEVRTEPAGGLSSDDPAAVALSEAQLFLRTMRITHGPLRAAVMDMTAMTTRQTSEADRPDSQDEITTQP
jgi:Family of unknown function (DUF6204)